jgi:hypothetical protein
MPKHNCHRRGCHRIRSEFSLFLSRRYPPRFSDQPFCSESCLLAEIEQVIGEKWDLLQSQRKRRVPRPKLGTILLLSHRLTRDQLETALEMQQKTSQGRLGEWLVRLGFVTEHHITQALSQQWGVPVIDLAHCDIQPGTAKLVPGRVAMCAGLLPVGYDDRQHALLVAMSNPIDFSSQGALRRMLRMEIVPFVADQSAVRNQIERCYAPAETDIDGCRSFGSRSELLTLVRRRLRDSISERAVNCEVELLEEYTWLRLDFHGATKHEVYRHTTPCLPDPAAERVNPAQLAYAGIH